MRTRIEKIRRRDLIEAAFRTFLDHGLGGTTVARIGRRAGMSHGIVNYYFKSKDQLLSAVMRHAFRQILRSSLVQLRSARTPRQRISAAIHGNFPADLYNRNTAAAWISFLAEASSNPEFGRLQDRFYRRLRRHLVINLGELTGPAQAERIALGISVWIDGLWLRSGMRPHALDRHAAIHAIEEYVDASLGQAAGIGRHARPRRAAAPPPARKLRRSPT